jgi:hypothetical protein
MNSTHPIGLSQNGDGLRLFGLSRIPQCSGCPRLEALQAIHDTGVFRGLPPVPRGCTYRFCRPLARRFRSHEGASVLATSAAAADPV